jgi:uncharacterized DUF497 family protein
MSMRDDRFDYGEVREVAFGRINDRLLFVFTLTGMRGDG